ncbi:hypothetical protein ACLB2K_004626 [Fragaria x ananassa]
MPGVPAARPCHARGEDLRAHGMPSQPACTPLTCQGFRQRAFGMPGVWACAPRGACMRALDMPGVPTARP